MEGPEINCVEVHMEDGQVHRYSDNYILVAIDEETGGVVGIRYLDKHPLTRQEVLIRALILVAEGFEGTARIGLIPLLEDIVEMYCKKLGCDNCDESDCPLRK